MVATKYSIYQKDTYEKYGITAFGLTRELDVDGKMWTIAKRELSLVLF